MNIGFGTLKKILIFKDILDTPKEKMLGEDPVFPLKHLFNKINSKYKIEFINLNRINDYDILIFLIFQLVKNL